MNEAATSLLEAAGLRGISSPVRQLAARALEEVEPAWRDRDARAVRITGKLLIAFSHLQLSDADLAGTTGYGYHDSGREKYERLLAEVFGAQAAFARLQFASGTHAIVTTVRALLGHGGRLVSLSGPPYDTLRMALLDSLSAEGNGALRYTEANWHAGAAPSVESVRTALGGGADVVFIQRSRGYAPRPSLSIDAIAGLVDQVRSTCPRAIVVIDNCYGELVEEREPLAAGADLLVGSLIKNPGGGLAPGGAYVAGGASQVAQVADALFGRGLGTQIGPTYHALPALFAGLHRAPSGIAASLKILDFAAALFAKLGFAVDPGAGAPRTDIIQAIRLSDRQRLLAFSEGLQTAMPVNPHARPVPGSVPGYRDPVVMALGGFVGGSTMELSCDAPLREPFEVYVQGGLDVTHGVLACMLAADRVVQTEGAAGRRENRA